MASGIQAFDKAIILQRTITNWPQVALDKLGLIKRGVYHTRSGLQFVCRAKSTDINEVVVVMSGQEYPSQYLGVPDGGVVFDIGANIGSFVAYFDHVTKIKNYRGFAFEPFSDNFALLQENVKLNQIKNFSLLQAAIYDTDGTVNIDTEVDPDAVTVRHDDSGIQVAAHKLSTFCETNNISRIDLLKMDVEGAEYVILEHDYAFFRTSVSKAILEYHIISENLNLERITKIIEKDFVITSVHSAATNGVIFIQNKRLAGLSPETATKEKGR